MNSIEDTDSTRPSQPRFVSVVGLESMPVVQIADFLPTHDRDALFEALCANRDAFQAPGNTQSYQGSSLYLSLDSSGSELPGVGAVREVSECLSKRILRLFPGLFTVLGVDPFSVSEIPLTFVNGRDGHIGTPHSDESGGRFKISLLYYLHKVPKAFRGGALQFYEADPASPSGHSDNALARIEHEDNLLIAFPSQTFHGTTDVQCDSSAFAGGRFVAIGFVGPQ